VEALPALVRLDEGQAVVVVRACTASFDLANLAEDRPADAAPGRRERERQAPGSRARRAARRSLPRRT
jgi:hypothetical protein